MFGLSKSSDAFKIFFSEIILGVLGIFISLSVFLKLSGSIVTGETVSFDASTTGFLYSFRSPFVNDIMRGITFFGGEIFLGTAIVITIFVLWKRHQMEAIIFSFILFFGIELNLLLKDIFQRPRPTLLPLVQESTFSFPSGHAMNSFIFFAALSFFVFWRFKNTNLKLILISISVILIFLIGISRIYLGAHYASDVVAGYCAGLTWFVSVLLVEKVIVYFKTKKH